MFSVCFGLCRTESSPFIYFLIVFILNYWTTNSRSLNYNSLPANKERSIGRVMDSLLLSGTSINWQHFHEAAFAPLSLGVTYVLGFRSCKLEKFVLLKKRFFHFLFFFFQTQMGCTQPVIYHRYTKNVIKGTQLWAEMPSNDKCLCYHMLLESKSSCFSDFQHI